LENNLRRSDSAFDNRIQRTSAANR